MAKVRLHAGWAMIGLRMGIRLREAGYAELAGICGREARGPLPCRCLERHRIAVRDVDGRAVEMHGTGHPGMLALNEKARVANIGDVVVWIADEITMRSCNHGFDFGSVTPNATLIQVLSCALEEPQPFLAITTHSPDRRSHEVRRIPAIIDHFRSSWRHGQCSACSA
jgi:hypothetical protein